MYAGGLRASFIKGNKFIHSNNSISEEEEIEERSTLIHEKRKKKKKVQAYGETYDASIIEREFPKKMEKMLLVSYESPYPPSRTNFLPNDRRKKWDRGSRKKEKGRKKNFVE